jgi:hypothetical protein
MARRGGIGAKIDARLSAGSKLSSCCTLLLFVEENMRQTPPYTDGGDIGLLTCP